MPDATGADEGVPATTPAELHRRLRDGRPSVLDLRDREAVEDWPLAGADVMAVPYPQALQAHLSGETTDLVEGLDEPVVVVCPVGEASAEIAGFLREAGVEARNLAGGMDAWARLLVATELERAPAGAHVVQYERPASGCLSYLVHDGSVGAVVDPLLAFADRYVADAAELGVELRYAVDTHVHADHLSGVRAVAERTDATVVLPAGAEQRGLAFDAELLADGDALALGAVDVAAVAAPGHTSEMTALRVDVPAAARPPVLLAGDSLFVDGVARPDLEEPDDAKRFAGELYDTLHERLLPMAGGTVVAPGHRGPSAMLADDGTVTATLDALSVRLDAPSMSRERFVEHVTAGGPRPANHERIIAVNLGRESVEEETAFELELGPNNCAAGG